MSKKELMSYVIIIVILVGILGVSFFLFRDKKTDSESKTVYAVVKENKKDYVVLEEVDTKKKVLVNKDMEVKEGDIIVLRYEGKIDDCEYEIIGNSIDLTSTTTTTTTVVSNSTNKVTSTTTTSVKTTTSINRKTATASRKITVTKKIDESELMKSIEEETNSSINESNKGKVKAAFIKLVDFIFYDGEIKGYKFKELTAKGKAKIIYYTLKLDGFIDDKWPGYKETISEKTKDIKDKLIAEYMNSISQVCTLDEGKCAEIKQDWQELKEKFKYSWNTVKDAFTKYAKPKASELINKLKEWYQVYSGKE